MGTTNLAVTGTWLEGIEERTYWVPPLHLLAQAGWYKIAGAGLTQMRAMSIAFGAIAVAMVYLIGRRLLCGRFAALLAAALLAIDVRWIVSGSTGRMDMMSASLGLTGVALYLLLRERPLALAVAAANSAIAASCLTHPCGVLHAAAFGVLFAALDRGRLSWRTLLAAVAPYIVALCLWGSYIARDPEAFVRQFGGNVSGFGAEAGKPERFSGLRNPMMALKAELVKRYYSQFGEWGDSKLAGALQVFTLGLYAAALGMALMSGRLRRTRHGRALVAAAAGVFVILWLFDASKTAAYLPHVLPWLILLGAYGFRRLAGGQAALACLLLAGVVGAQAVAHAANFRKNTLESETRAVARFLSANVQPGERVVGGAEFGFVAPGPLQFIDDSRMGFLTGVRPGWIVLSRWYGVWQASAGRRDPAFGRYAKALLEQDSREVFRAGSARVFRLEPTAAKATEVR